MSNTYTLAASIATRDNSSPVIDKIRSHFGALKDSIKGIDPELKQFESGLSSLKVGATSMAIGTGGAMLAKSFFDARKEVVQFESDIRSLGVSVQGVKSISDIADQTSVALGTTKNSFLQAAYDIKSGISSLSDDAVGEFTRLVATTAAATKGDTAQLGSYFGTVYNLYKKTYSDMSDADFGRMLANQTAYAVQQYKTDGSKMQAAMESVGPAAQAVGMQLNEQIAILGRLSNKMGGGEAGTALRSFAQNASKAGNELGLSFTNSEGQLKPVADIIGLITQKYGDLNNAATQDVIKKAFGTDEAVRALLGLKDYTGELKNEITALEAAGSAGIGKGIVDQMAKLRTDNAAAGITKMNGAWEALKGSLGRPLENVFGPIAEGAAKATGAIADFFNEHQGVATAIAGTLALGSVILFVYGAIKTARGAMLLYSLAQQALTASAPPAAAASGGLAAALRGVAASAASSTAALLTNPVTWIVVGCVLMALAVAYVVRNWDDLKRRFMEAPVWLKLAAGWVVYMLGPIMWITIGIMTLRDHWDMIKNKTMSAVSAMVSAWERLPGPAKATIGVLLAIFGGIPGLIVGIIANWDAFADKVQAVTSKMRSMWQQVPGPIKVVLGVIMAIAGAVPGVVALIVLEWDKIKAAASGAVDFMSNRINEVKKFFGFDVESKGSTEKAHASGKKFGETYAAGIRSSKSSVESAMEGLTGSMTPYMNQSDAKKGPLARTSQFGRSFVKTWGAGVEDETGRTKVPQKFADIQAKTINPESKGVKNIFSAASSSGGASIKADTLAKINLTIGDRKLTREELGRMLVDLILGELDAGGLTEVLNA